MGGQQHHTSAYDLGHVDLKGEEGLLIFLPSVFSWKTGHGHCVSGGSCGTDWVKSAAASTELERQRNGKCLGVQKFGRGAEQTFFSHITMSNLFPSLPPPSSSRLPTARLCLFPCMTTSHCFCLFVFDFAVSPSKASSPHLHAPPLPPSAHLPQPLSITIFHLLELQVYAGWDMCCFVSLRFHTFQMLSPGPG